MFIVSLCFNFSSIVIDIGLSIDTFFYNDPNSQIVSTFHTYNKGHRVGMPTAGNVRSSG